MNNCILLINGHQYGGWKDISIQRGLEQLSGQFNLRVTERWPGQLEARPIRRGDECVVKIDDEAVATGYINQVRTGFDSGNTWLEVSGRDKTGDLIDCAAVFKTGQWKNSTVQKIALDLIRPFKVDLIIGARAAQKAAETIVSFALEDGEAVLDTLTRLLRMKALMQWTDGAGRLVIDLPAVTAGETALVEGENLLSCEAVFDESELFSEYTVKGQTRGKHDSKGTAKDDSVHRYRPMLILAEDHGNTPADRAKHEATMRAGKAERVNARVQSWRQAGDAGALWTPGLRVPVRAPHAHMDKELIICQVEYICSDQDGTVTQLELTDPMAFDLLAKNPTKPKTRGKRRRGAKT